MNVIRVYAIVEGVKGKDRKVKRHIDTLKDIDVVGRNDFSSIATDKVKEYLNANLDANALTAYLSKFKKINKIKLSINLIEREMERGYVVETFMQFDEKSCVIL
jgi:hypothetical protein